MCYSLYFTALFRKCLGVEWKYMKRNVILGYVLITYATLIILHVIDLRQQSYDTIHVFYVFYECAYKYK